MDDESIAKIELQGKMEGTRKRVKPRTAWMSAVEERTWIGLHRATEKDSQECWNPRQTDTTQKDANCSDKAQKKKII